MNNVILSIFVCINNFSIIYKQFLLFADFIDQIFDCLNSRRFKASKPYSSALHRKHPYIEKALRSAIPYFTKLEKVGSNGSISRPPCFDGLVQTINGILLYYRTEREENDDIYILTNKLNQDALENLFGTFRQKGGYNLNPTGRIFRTNFRTYVVNNLIKPAKEANYEDSYEELLIDENEENTNPVDTSVVVPETAVTSVNLPQFFTDQSDEEVASSSSSQESKSSSESENLEQCATKYFAGYLVEKTIKKFNCKNCKEYFLSKNIFFTDKNEILLFHKLYKNIIKASSTDGLKIPSNEIYKITKISLNTFSRYFNKYCNEKKVGKNILNKIDRKLRRYTMNKKFCPDHLNFLLKLLVTTKIFKETRNFCAKTDIKCQKLKILQHT